MIEIAAVLITCTPSAGDFVEGYFLYSSPHPVESVDDMDWRDLSIGECRFEIDPNDAVGLCWYITAVERGKDDDDSVNEQSQPTRPACLVVRIRQ